MAASFVLTHTAFILFLSQVLCVYPAKHVLSASVAIFEVGSALCGAAQDVNTLISGRALSGVGAAGILTGILQVMAQATRLEDRPTLFSLFESVFALYVQVAAFSGRLDGLLTVIQCLYYRVRPHSLIRRAAEPTSPDLS